MRGLLIFLPALGLAQDASYEKLVEPVLEARCVVCHPSGSGAGDVSLGRYEEVMEAGIVTPGKPEQSLLLRLVEGAAARMPKSGAKLKAEEVAGIRKWIEAGAKREGKGESGERVWWSLRPLRPGAQRTIDGYLEQRLREKGLRYRAEAPRRVLIRRLSFDLHGLPPEPEEIAAFDKDGAPGAYERLVDRMLASPRYGERWARHWLDVVHYGDSHGYDKDKPRVNAWPYRDAVIRALNEDLPYRDFVRQQLAGDVLYPNDARAFEMTGFLAAGPWDFVGHQELKEATADKKLTRSLDRDDMVANAMGTFVSLTVHCARCHDHKFDPIPQEDYYRVQAVFAGLDRVDRPYDEDAGVFARRRELLEQKRRVQLRIRADEDEVEFASSPELTELDNRIQDASLLLAHLGTPKNAAEEAEKKRLEDRRVADRAARQKLIEGMTPRERFERIAAGRAELKRLDEELGRLPKPKLVYSGASYFTRMGNLRPALEPREVAVLGRGNVGAPGKVVSAGAPRLVGGLAHEFGSPEEGARRAGLAEWIVSDGNVLAWRSIVNRVWHYHFGQGIVDSPSDFGRMGGMPTHPKLLDWLAVWFRDEAKGSLKQLHRLMVTSRAYRQGSETEAAAEKVDAENRLFWRMNRAKLDAESVHDAALWLSGKLDLRMGGPGVRRFWFKDDHSPVYDYARFSPDAEQARRRAIYRFIVRSVPDPFYERLDCPDPSIQTPKRLTTLTTIQALAMWNNPFMVRMAEWFAERVGGDVGAAVRLAYGREMRGEERAPLEEYARKHGMANLCRLILNSNEFLFLD
ncbi:MAG: DUF1553 domain-containing protein [Acidobacteriota bacterium]